MPRAPYLAVWNVDDFPSFGLVFVDEHFGVLALRGLARIRRWGLAGRVTTYLTYPWLTIGFGVPVQVLWNLHFRFVPLFVICRCVLGEGK